MPFELREFYSPFTIIAILVGFQTAIYFLYIYYKVKDEKLELNKILLAYGVLFIISLISIGIRTVNSYYNQDPELYVILIQVSNFPLLFSLEVYLLIISTKGFEKLTKPNITRTFIILLVVPIIMNFTLGPYSEVYLITLIIIAPATMTYLLILQIKLLKLSAGNMRKKLIVITCGLFLIFFAVSLGGYSISEVVLGDYYHLNKLISTPLLVAGFTMVFLGIYRFPGLLEFDWKDNLKQLFIIDNQRYKLLYSINIENLINGDLNAEGQNSEDKETFFSKGLLGIEEIISTITNTSDKKIKQITHRDFFLLLNHGSEEYSSMTYSLVVNKDMESLRYFLKYIKQEFENNFKSILINIEDIEGSEKKIFSGFDDILKNMIKYH